jgi:hypothetical protein
MVSKKMLIGYLRNKCNPNLIPQWVLDLLSGDYEPGPDEKPPFDPLWSTQPAPPWWGPKPVGPPANQPPKPAWPPVTSPPLPVLPLPLWPPIFRLTLPF